MTKENIIAFIVNKGGQIVHNSFGKHGDKNLGGLSINFGEWRFNAWFNPRTNYFHSPCYFFGYVGNLEDMTIKDGLDEMINLIKTNKSNKLKYGPVRFKG